MPTITKFVDGVPYAAISAQIPVEVLRLAQEHVKRNKTTMQDFLTSVVLNATSNQPTDVSISLDDLPRGSRDDEYDFRGVRRLQEQCHLTRQPVRLITAIKLYLIEHGGGTLQAFTTAALLNEYARRTRIKHGEERSSPSRKIRLRENQREP